MIARRERRTTEKDTLSLRVTYTLTDIRSCLSNISKDYNAIGLSIVLRADLMKMVGTYLFGYLCQEAKERFAAWAIKQAISKGMLVEIGEKTLKFSL